MMKRMMKTMMFQVTSNFLWMVYKISLVMIMVRSANILWFYFLVGVNNDK